MVLPTNHSLDVPGARLHYEVNGSGPVLMLIGHPMGLAGRGGVKRALVAVAHSLLAIIYALLTRQSTYADVGAAYVDEWDRHHTSNVSSLDCSGSVNASTWN